MHDDDKVSIRLGDFDDFELGWVREYRLGGEALARLQHLAPSRFGNPRGPIRRLHRGILKLVALDDVRIDERAREARSDAVLVKGRFAGTIRPGKQDKARPQAAVSSLAYTRLPPASRPTPRPSAW